MLDRAARSNCLSVESSRATLEGMQSSPQPQDSPDPSGSLPASFHNGAGPAESTGADKAEGHPADGQSPEGTSIGRLIFPKPLPEGAKDQVVRGGALGFADDDSVDLDPDSDVGRVSVGGRELVIERSVDESIDLPVYSKPKSALERAGLTQRSYPTECGDRIAALLELFLSQDLKPSTALLELAPLRLGRALEPVLADLAEAIEGGDLVSQAFRKHEKVFGRALIEFVEIGERGYGLRDSLARYLAMREGLRTIDGDYRHKMFSNLTRRFAFVTGTVLEMTGDVPLALKVGACEEKRSIRKGVAEGLLLVHAGEGIAECLPKRRLFRAGFEESFIELMKAAEEHSMLAEALRGYADL